MGGQPEASGTSDLPTAFSNQRPEAPVMRAAAVILFALVAACERGPQSEANLPKAPGAATPPTSTGDLPQPTPPANVTSCTVIPPEAATAAKISLPAVGSAAGWTINGSSLVCSEPGVEGAVECELAAGGIVVASQADQVYGFRNDTGAPLSITVNTQGMSCGPIGAPPSPS
jgi:hypothetical protein